MNAKDFLEEHLPEDFPQTQGPWISWDRYEPPFTRAELREMRKQGLIDLDERRKKYRMTQVALSEYSKLGKED